MAVYIAAADGVLSSAAAVWKTVDATSYLYAVNGSTALTTAYVESQATTPGAITVRGIAVHIAARVASPTGTMSVRIAQAGATVAGTEVTINVSDIDRPGGVELHAPGLYFFKFAAPVTLAAATLYTTSAKCSVNGEVSLYRNATAGNWSRMWQTDTFGNPAAGDDWHILGEWTAAGTKTNRTVTMDETVAVDYGVAPGTDLNLQGITIGKGGTLNFGTTASTNYVLQASTGIRVWAGGILNMGTTATPVPITSTATIQFDCAADGDFGLLVDGTFNAQGVARTAGKNVVVCKLNTDEAAAQTVLGVDTDTGWLNGDIVDLAPTSRTFSESEQRTMNANAGASSIQVSAGLTNAHSGTSPTQAEVINITRNVVVRSLSTTNMAFVAFGPTATVDCDWVWFRYLGQNSDYKFGVQVRTQAGGSCAMDYCSVTDFETAGVYIGGTNVTSNANVSINNTVLTSRQAATISVGFQATDSDGSNYSVNGVYVTAIDGTAGGRVGIIIGAVPNGTFSNLVAAGCEVDGIQIATPTTTASLLSAGTFTGVTAHSNQTNGLTLSGDFTIKITTCNVWRNNANTSEGGISVSNPGIKEIIGGSLFGNNLQNIFLSGVTVFIGRNLTIAGDTTFATADGVEFNGSQTLMFAKFTGCTFGSTSGIFVAHTNDINLGAGRKIVDITLVHTKLDSATEFTNTGSLQGQSVIRHQRVDQATNVHKRVYQAVGGTASYDTTTVRNSVSSEKLAPSNAPAAAPLESSVLRARVQSGHTVSVAVWGQKDASFSGTATLYLKANPALGVTTDTLLATFSGAINTWVQLSGTTPAATEKGVFEFVVRVTGTGGAFYIDDWSAA